MTRPNYDELFSDRSKQMKASEIRELLKLTHRPNIISFAGGLPNPLSFPTKELGGIANELGQSDGEKVFQYGTTEGVPRLRELIAGRLNQHCDMGLTPDDILITSGSQQGLYLLGKVFTNNKDSIIVGAPTYLGALQAFRTFRPTFHSIELDDDGMPPDKLEVVLKTLKKEGKKPKFIYLVPTFQNPAGVTIPLERRKEILELAEEYATLIAEDDPYGELRFDGDPVPPFKSLDKNGRVIYLGTFSKVMAPGFRLAFSIGPPEIIHRFVIAKQGVDLCTNTFTQHIAAEFVSRGLLDPQVKRIRELYGRKRDVMLKALKDFAIDGMEWTRPRGGMFLWVKVPKCIDTEVMFKKAVENGVAYVHGAAFYHDRSVKNAMRLNFSHATDDKIVEGIERLCNVIRAEMKS